MTDGLGRRIDYLRLSVTDRCNLRCVYCMPPEGACGRERDALCSFEELSALAAAFVELGVTKLRLTGGEPLVRAGIVSLVERLNALRPLGLRELGMTTNGLLLPSLAAPLRSAGLDRLNLSLDTLRPARYRALTRGGELEGLWDGIAAAEAAGFGALKLNAVLLPGFNDDELRDLALLARDHPWSVRFIERMPIGPAAELGFLPADRVLEAVPELRELRQPAGKDGVARLFSAPGWRGTVGLITPLSRDFCAECSRVRLSADGRLKLCLHAAEEIPLRGLRGEALRAAILSAVARKPARHSLRFDCPSESIRSMNEIGG